MKTKQSVRKIHRLAVIVTSIVLVLAGVKTALAYEDYSGCKVCHGDFRGNTSTKGTIFPGDKNHEMHRNSANMATACDLCHSGSSRTPVYTKSSNGTASNPGLGCTGCHMPVGLRAHHVNHGVSDCTDCHEDGPAPAENVKPPYYGTVDTKANNPGNTALAVNTNENWSVGDFLGLDNDGNNLYDLADYAIGPFQLLGLNRENDNVRVTWLTAGGRSDKVQATPNATASYADLSPAIAIPGVGLVTNSFVDVGGASNAVRFYRMSATVP
jgi:hypothetical protein